MHLTGVIMVCSYYGHLSQRFCNINRTYQELFEQCFGKQYGLIHRLETNKLRNVARLFAVSDPAASTTELLHIHFGTHLASAWAANSILVVVPILFFPKQFN